MTDDQWINLWSSDKTMAELADEHRISVRTISSAWRRLKLAGLLPMGDRPRTTRKYGNSKSDHRDGRMRISMDDPLLMRLKNGSR